MAVGRSPLDRGRNRATRERIGDLGEAAGELGRFVAALQRIDPGDGPLPEERGSSRGAPLATRDLAVREAIAALSGTLAAELADRCLGGGTERTGVGRPAGLAAWRSLLKATCLRRMAGSQP